MIPGAERPVIADPAPWCVVELRTDLMHGRFYSEWAAYLRADRLNRSAGFGRFTVDVAPREPMFRFTWQGGGTMDSPGKSVEEALSRMQRHAEEFASVKQLDFPVDRLPERIE